VAHRVARRSARKIARTITTDALVVRNVPYGESDVIATLLTPHEGKVSAIVRGARKGTKRTFGALEPMHTIRITYEDKGTELVTVKEARVVHARTRMLADLDALEAGGLLLRWARHMFPAKTDERDAFATLEGALDALDGRESDPRAVLASAGLALLSHVGWGVELARCVTCGTPCPEDASAQLDADKGGIVCRRCGGARVLIRADARRAAIDGSMSVIAPHAKAIVALVEAAMAAHAGFRDT